MIIIPIDYSFFASTINRSRCGPRPGCRMSRAWQALSRPHCKGRSILLRQFSVASRGQWLHKILKRGSSEDKPGVFGLPGLHSANDWYSIAERCSEKCKRLANEIRTHSGTRNPSLLHKFDELSNDMCIVLDTAELCRNVHPDPAFSRGAEEAYLAVSNVVQHLNADYELYAPLAELNHSVSSTKDSSRGGFTAEDLHMVKSLTLDFEKGGITLPLAKKKRLIDLQGDINRLSSEFMASSNSVLDSVAIPRSKLYSVPKALHNSFKRSRTSPHLVMVPCDASTVHTMLRHVSDSETRELLYRTFHGFHMKQGLPILDKLLTARHELSSILGMKSYAEMQFEGRLGSSPGDVLEFLYGLSELTTPKAQQEVHVLESLRNELNGHAESSPLKGWDRQYYIGRAKTSQIDPGLRDITSYLPLTACIGGIAMIMREAFGVKMETEKATENELWHRSVSKVRLTNANGVVLGHIFFDLRPRPGKYGHAAHFCIRCGRSPGPGQPYQTPIVALVCNFERVGANGVQLLSPGEYETLWHEVGHAMHSLLSRTKYQHLSGTRVATDFVEVPSHVFEHYAWDPRVLQRVARHYQTGDRMPTRMLKAAYATRNSFAAIDLQNQALFSAMDLCFHSRSPPVGNTTRVFHELSDQMTVFPHDSGVATHSSFQHLVGYGAGYYSYIFAKIISAQIWSELFADDPFSLSAGKTFADGVLLHGSAKPAQELVQGILRTKPSCAPLLKSLGITKLETDLTLPLSQHSEP